jgi:hypothetical protein
MFAPLLLSLTRLVSAALMWGNRLAAKSAKPLWIWPGTALLLLLAVVAQDAVLYSKSTARKKQQ